MYGPSRRTPRRRYPKSPRSQRPRVAQTPLSKSKNPEVARWAVAETRSTEVAAFSEWAGRCEHALRARVGSGPIDRGDLASASTRDRGEHTPPGHWPVVRGPPSSHLPVLHPMLAQSARAPASSRTRTKAQHSPWSRSRPALRLPDLPDGQGGGERSRSRQLQGSQALHPVLRRARCELGPLNLGTDLEDGPLSSPVITEY